MSVERSIQAAVARADLIICYGLRVMAVVALAGVLILAVLLVRARLPDPYVIDYDAPGVDVTSEGPEEDAETWNKAGGDGR